MIIKGECSGKTVPAYQIGERQTCTIDVNAITTLPWSFHPPTVGGGERRNSPFYGGERGNNYSSNCVLFDGELRFDVHSVRRGIVSHYPFGVRTTSLPFLDIHLESGRARTVCFRYSDI